MMTASSLMLSGGSRCSFSIFLSSYHKNFWSIQFNKVEILDNDECNRLFGIMTETMMCTSGRFSTLLADTVHSCFIICDILVVVSDGINIDDV